LVMQVGLNELWRLSFLRRLAEMGGGAGALCWLWLRIQGHKRERQRETRIREELEAYARLGVRLVRGGDGDGDVRELGQRVCRVVAAKSAFYRVAMLARDAEGRLSLVGSAGMEGLTVQAINLWGEQVADAERISGFGGRRNNPALGMRVGNNSFAVVLEAGGVGIGRAIVIPLRTTAGRMLGAMAVGAEGMLSRPRRAVEEALEPLEALAVKLGRAMENAELAERLLRAEKLAGLGLLAGGVAHALNNPLTAVLGFAELIADTSDEGRVKRDAKTIVREALRMRETVNLLLEFWRPAMRQDEAVEVSELLRELARECREKLENRGVRLVVQVGDGETVVRGSRDRLRQVLEHLMNNAAQAVAETEAPLGGHVIRLSVSREEEMVHVIVSDTGKGFSEPGRVFDPLYTTRGAGAGLGLSICYGIVREHGGEISAYNLHPQGATVVVELPVGEIFAEKNSGVVREAVSARK
jgi:signal transduction histidine kinase